MHEWRITEAVIEEILKHSRENAIKKILRIVLSIGEDTDLTPDSIRFCFDALRKEHKLEDAKLEILSRKGRGGIIVESIEGSAD